MRTFAWSGLLVLLLAGRALADAAAAEGSPSTPDQRYAEARQLMERGLYLEAADGFRGVADSEDADERLRALALYSSGLMLENARVYERAVSTYEEVQKRFPGTDFATRAKGQQEVLKTGGARWTEYRRRLDEAWDERSRAAALIERDGPQAGREQLERAAGLFEGLLRDFGDEPSATNLAMALGETRMLLGRFREARADYERAVALARARMAESGSGAPGSDNLVLGAEEQLATAEIALRREQITMFARILLAAAVAVFLAIRPWRAVDRRGLVLGGSLAAVTLLLAVFAAAVSYGVRVYVDPGSPITESIAALFVVLPGLTGELIAMGVVGRLRAGSASSGIWPMIAGAGLGAVAAFAVATCLVDSFELFPVLDSML